MAKPPFRPQMKPISGAHRGYFGVGMCFAVNGRAVGSAAPLHIAPTAHIFER